MGVGDDRSATPLTGRLVLALLAACAGGRAAAPPAPRVAAARPAREAEADGDDAAAVAAVERAVNQESAAIHTCWAMGAADDFHLEGEVVLSVLIGDGGTAEKVEVVHDTTGDEVLVDCLKALWAAHRWPGQVFTARDTVQLPPFRFGAPAAQYTVSSAHVPKRPLGPDGPAAASTVQVLLQPDNTGNSAAALSLLELAPGMKAPRHRHTSAELLFVLSGQGRVGARRVRAGDAVYIAAGAAHELDNESGSKAPLVAVQLHAPAGPERSPCEIAPDVSRKDCEPGPRTGLPGDETRDPAIRAASAARAREHSILAGKGAARIVFDAASARDDAASLVALTLDAGSEMPRHLHDGSSEYLLLLEGSGILVIGEEQIPVAAGDAIQIPSGIEHGFRAAAGGPLKALEFFAPAGPEQRFKDQKR